MKNQYFADSRDLFKYDLAISFMLDYAIAKNFTFVPMLTPNTGNNHGSMTVYKAGRPGTHRTKLVEFLSECLRQDRRNITELERFFKQSLYREGVSMKIYNSFTYITKGYRKDYFDRLSHTWLKDSVIMVDPDTGLETASSNKNKEAYVTYGEVKNLYDKMSKKSVMLIFQFIPRVERLPYLSGLCRKLKSRLGKGCGVDFISNNSVAFFVISKSRSYKRIVDSALRDYSERYNLIFGRN